MAGQLLNNEIENDMKETAVVYFNVLPRYSPGGTKKNQDSPSPG
jgi:hypothetical protein